MIDTNNPAGRLLTILERATAYSSSLRFNDSVTNSNGWAYVLELDSATELDVVRAVLDVAELVRKTRSLIESFAPNPQLYLKGYENIELAVVPGDLRGDFQNTIKRVTSENLAHLRFGCDLLAKSFSEKEMAEGDLLLLKQLADELFELASKANIGDSLKKYILESIELIRRSIALHRIHGANGLRDSLKLTLVGMVEHSDELKIAKETNPGLIEKFGFFAEKLDKIVSAATRTKELIGVVIDLLPIK